MGERARWGSGRCRAGGDLRGSRRRFGCLGLAWVWSVCGGLSVFGGGARLVTGYVKVFCTCTGRPRISKSRAISLLGRRNTIIIDLTVMYTATPARANSLLSTATTLTTLRVNRSPPDYRSHVSRAPAASLQPTTAAPFGTLQWPSAFSPRLCAPHDTSHCHVELYTVLSLRLNTAAMSSSLYGSSMNHSLSESTNDFLLVGQDHSKVNAAIM